MGSCISPYGPSQTETHLDVNYSVGICSMQGSRKKMEDAYCICLSFNNHPLYSLFAVFDGFNGYDASQYLANHLVTRLNKLNNLNNDQMIIDAINKMDKQFLKSTVRDTLSGSTVVFAICRRINDISVNTSTNNISYHPPPNTPNISNTPNITTSLNSNPYSFSSESSQIITPSVTTPSFGAMEMPITPITAPSQRYNDRTTSFEALDSISGNTSISPYQANKKYGVRIFWIGDSKAVIIKDETNWRKFEEVTIAHHCSLQTEMERIYKSSINEANDNENIIINNKIDGITELSRSFGCHSMKNNNNLRDCEQKHICIAECRHILCKSNETLLLFSDGLTERWSNKQLSKKYNFHWNQHKDYPHPIQNSLTYLCEECIDNGSSDNITAISIRFK